MQTTLEEGDKERLRSQREKIMQKADGNFRSLLEWSQIGGGSEAGTSARIRQIASEYGYIKQLKKVGKGFYLYALTPPFYEEKAPQYPQEEYGQLMLSL